MNKTYDIDSYLKKTTREMVCFRSTKKRIVKGLKQEFCEQADETDPVRYFGDPKELAATLQEDIDSTEESRAKRIKRYAIIACIVATLLLIAGTAVYLKEMLDGQPTRVVETIFDVTYYTE